MTTLANFDFDYTRGIQKCLNEKLQINLTCDGDFGPKSIAALKDYQVRNTLPMTGVYDSATQAKLEPFLLSKFVTRPDFEAAAVELGVSLAQVKAFQETETNGCGFLNNGKPKILFERHWFYSCLKQKKSATELAALAKANPDILSPVPYNSPGTETYLGGNAEYTRFNRAFAIDQEAAMMSCSWGLGQILGVNCIYAGFKKPDGSADVAAYVGAMKVSEQEQLKAFVAFIKNYRGGVVLTNLKAKNWSECTRYYNGPGQIAVYAPRLASNYERFSKMYG